MSDHSSSSDGGSDVAPSDSSSSDSSEEKILQSFSPPLEEPESPIKASVFGESDDTEEIGGDDDEVLFHKIKESLDGEEINQGIDVGLEEEDEEETLFFKSSGGGDEVGEDISNRDDADPTNEAAEILKSELEELKNDFEEEREAWSQRENDLVELVENFKNQSEEMSSKFYETKNSLEEKDSEIMLLSDDHSKLVEEHSIFKSKFEEMKEELSRKENSNDDLEKKNVNLKKKEEMIEELREKIGQLEEKNRSLVKNQEVEEEKSKSSPLAFENDTETVRISKFSQTDEISEQNESKSHEIDSIRRSHEEEMGVLRSTIEEHKSKIDYLSIEHRRAKEQYIELYSSQSTGNPSKYSKSAVGSDSAKIESPKRKTRQKKNESSEFFKKMAAQTITIRKQKNLIEQYKKEISDLNRRLSFARSISSPSRISARNSPKRKKRIKKVKKSPEKSAGGGYSEDIEELKKSMRMKDTIIWLLEKDKANSEAKSDPDNNQEFQALKRRFEEMKKRAFEAERKFRSFRSKISDLKVSNNQLRCIVKNREDQICGYSKAISDDKKYIKHLRSQLTKVRAEKITIQKKLKELNVFDM